MDAVYVAILITQQVLQVVGYYQNNDYNGYHNNNNNFLYNHPHHPNPQGFRRSGGFSNMPNHFGGFSNNYINSNSYNEPNGYGGNADFDPGESMGHFPPGSAPNGGPPRWPLPDGATTDLHLQIGRLPIYLPAFGGKTSKDSVRMMGDVYKIMRPVPINEKVVRAKVKDLIRTVHTDIPQVRLGDWCQVCHAGMVVAEILKYCVCITGKAVTTGGKNQRCPEGVEIEMEMKRKLLSPNGKNRDVESLEKEFEEDEEHSEREKDYEHGEFEEESFESIAEREWAKVGVTIAYGLRPSPTPRTRSDSLIGGYRTRTTLSELRRNKRITTARPNWGEFNSPRLDAFLARGLQDFEAAQQLSSPADNLYYYSGNQKKPKKNRRTKTAKPKWGKKAVKDKKMSRTKKAQLQKKLELLKAALVAELRARVAKKRTQTPPLFTTPPSHGQGHLDRLIKEMKAILDHYKHKPNQLIKTNAASLAHDIATNTISKAKKV